MKNAKPLRIVWAVDPLGEEFAFQAAAAEFLRRLGERANVEIHPIYVYGSYPLEYSPYRPVELKAEERDRMRAALAGICERSALRGIRDLEIVVQGFANLGEGVGILVDRAEAIEADAILATTHARKGVTRWIIGSFAEALMAKSTLPLLVVNPESKLAWDPGKAVFATDLSSESRCAFKRFLALASALGTEVTIYHQAAHSLSEGLAPAFSGTLVTGESADRKNRRSEEIAETWRTVARSAGVEANFLLDRGLAGSPADGALAKAERAGAWIAIAAQSEPKAVLRLGSNARHVLRSARVPVWLFRAPSANALCDPIEFSEADVAADLRLGRGGEES